ncbi:MAG: tripartite tricarboxylate transporter permease [Nanoarchaeota archaeon]|nr:tripartite tricarboxylate transporter permease [Nanoarchaeota archaeon]MBU1501357.1 tripartite tricarboxylate transporter permease [Nanoarchaeota archaeon]MBU2443768.1 tripartite tricarboxylate transporter permease [Nanoarchaeota archaeon]
MLIEIILFMFLGIAAGTFTGLIPGIHINLVGVSLVALSASLFSSLNPIYIVTFISSMAITHTFLDFIPSIFLGCPDTDTELSVLPGHELLKSGKGYEAVLLTIYGSLAAIFILIIITFPSILILNNIYSTLQKITPYILIAVMFFLIYVEKNRVSATLVIILTGALGFIILNLSSLKEPLFPMLTGLFGTSMLIISIKNKVKIPEQEISKPKMDKSFLSPLMGATIAAPFSSLLPGLGSGQAAVLGNSISKTGKRGFLFLLGATNTLVMGFSFVTFYAVLRTRTGAVVAIQEIAGNLSGKMLILILSIITISGIISFFWAISLTKFFSKRISTINYSRLSIITISTITILVFLFSGGLGLIVFAVSTFTGIYCISLNVRRTNMMGCLLIPTIILYLF